MQYKIKVRILTNIYQSETLRFLNFLPISAVESFLESSLSEVEHIYSYFTGSSDLDKNKLKVYRHLFAYLKERRSLLQTRPF